jgi:glycine/D-amino acid oxidase-like deaminating enzyme
VELLDFIPEVKFDSGPAIRFTRQAQFNPLKYMNALASICSKRGVEIYTNTHVSKVEGGTKAFVETSNGFKVNCDFIFVATNVPVNDRFSMFTKLEPMRSYVIAAKIPKGSVPHALFWDTEDPYHYVRVTSGPDAQHEILVVGGEDHEVGHKHDFENVCRSFFSPFNRDLKI